MAGKPEGLAARSSIYSIANHLQRVKRLSRTERRAFFCIQSPSGLDLRPEGATTVSFTSLRGTKPKEAIMKTNTKTSLSNKISGYPVFRPIALMAVALVVFGWSIPAVFADDDDNEIPFDVAEIYFELNDTDGDLGIHALIDGDEWKRLEIEDPRERKMLNIFVRGRLRRQGLTELFFESAEPTFDELAPERFFRRFPEGEYEIEGVTLEGEELESTAELTHLIPAPPSGIEVSGVEILPDEVDCDEDIPVVDGEDGIVISWDPVTHSHLNLGRTNEFIEVVNYQVVVEEDESELVFSVHLPPDETAVTVPSEFIDLGDEFKFEILVREASGNQTAVESCFALE